MSLRLGGEIFFRSLAGNSKNCLSRHHHFFSVNAPVKHKDNWKLNLAALGVVFGDIGTSPLYAVRECLRQAGTENYVSAVLGSLSLIFWLLILIVSVKYIALISRADNRGEGGIFALLALGWKDQKKMTLGILFVLFGAALLYGDGVITPAISILSAAEGFKSFDPDLGKWVVPIACAILAALFWGQKYGTGKIGGVFGPLMMIWFVVIGALGLHHIAKYPAILAALNPIHGIKLLVYHPNHLTGILGAVVLAITGAEALYADMGHFGRKAIIKSWYGIVLPGLMLNYFGQGAYALSHPNDIANPFFSLVPEGHWRVALTILSIVATIIASQALITGTFSLTQQGIQLGFFPRLLVKHTSDIRQGQIYMPAVNFALAVGCLALTLGFKSSANLASAYGLAVTGTMVVTSIAFYAVMKKVWKWKYAEGALAVMLCIDLLLFFSNLGKFFEGGWLPIVIAVGLFAIMHTWKKGRAIITEKLYGISLPPEEVIADVKKHKIHRVPGEAVFMAANPHGTPVALLHHLKVNQCLHKTVILLSLVTDPVPRIESARRCGIINLGSGIWQVIARHGYMEWPNVQKIIQYAQQEGVPCNPDKVIYYFNRESVVTNGKSHIWKWQKAFYGFLSRNARQARDYFDLPPNQVVEMGLPVQI